MFFQNVFDSDFMGSMIYSDRQYNITYKVGPNINKTYLMVNWVDGPYDLTTFNVLTINISLDKGIYYSPINVTLPASANLTSFDIVTALNNDVNFKTWFDAEVYGDGSVNPTQYSTRIKINANKTLATRQSEIWKCYISNTSAERVLGFNRKCPVAELPTYYNRHTIAQRPNFSDGVGMLILLDTSLAQDQAIITNAGFDYTNVQPDWKLLTGRAETFRFNIKTYDGSSRLTSELIFNSGAKAGDMSLLRLYTYVGATTAISAVYDTPHTLTALEVAGAIPP